MEILDIIEEKDGYCDMNVVMDDEEVKFLLNYAINEILKKQIDKMEENL